MQCKGYYTSSSYFGLVNETHNEYMQFPTDTEYSQYIKERDSNGFLDDGETEQVV